MFAALLTLLVAHPHVGTASTATVVTWSPIPRVVVYPTTALEPAHPEAQPIPKERLTSFDGELRDAIGSVYQWRRWEVVPRATLAEALEAYGDECRGVACRGRLAMSLGASAWIESTLQEARPIGGEANEGNRSAKRGATCVVTITRWNLPANTVAGSEYQEVTPCTADNLLAAAMTLGQKVAHGPQAPVRVTLNLTPLEVPHLDVPDIANLRKIQTASAARTRTTFELDRALEIYKSQHLFTFRADGDVWVGRGGQILTECDLRLAASAPLPDALREVCFGNDWEWAWLGAPAGGLLALGSLSGFQDGDMLGVVGFTLGMGTALTSALLAVLFNRDAQPPDRHVYLSSWRELEGIVKEANARLRKSLELTEAEVELAGLPK